MNIYLKNILILKTIIIVFQNYNNYPIIINYQNLLIFKFKNNYSIII